MLAADKLLLQSRIRQVRLDTCCPCVHLLAASSCLFLMLPKPPTPVHSTALQPCRLLRPLAAPRAVHLILDSATPYSLGCAPGQPLSCGATVIVYQLGVHGHGCAFGNIRCGWLGSLGWALRFSRSPLSSGRSQLGPGHSLCFFFCTRPPCHRHPLHCGVLSCVSPHCLAATVECDPAQGKRVHVAQLQFCDSGYTGMNVRLLGVECCLSR